MDGVSWQTGDGPHLWSGPSKWKEGRHLEKDRAGGKAEMNCQDKEEEEKFRPQDFSGEEDRVRRLGMDCFSEAASTGTQEGGIWRRTVPVARLQCRQWRRAATANETVAGECAEMRAVGAAEELERLQVGQPGDVREAASGAARYFQWSGRLRQQG